MDSESSTPTPFASGNFYSKAFDFLSHISAEVDPRTGSYGAHVAFPSGEGNRLRGPHFEFRLIYNALNQDNMGFGRGWQLGVTHFDRANGMLSLDSGEVHRVDQIQNGYEADIPDRKLKSFRLTPIDSRSSIVEYATGVVEHLRNRTASDIQRAVRIINPSGDSIHLLWRDEAGKEPFLLRVEDDDHQPLMTFEYPGIDRAIMSIYTGLNEPLKIHFDVTSLQLNAITIPLVKSNNAEALRQEEDEAKWIFGYTTISEIRLLESLTSPDGTEARVIYSAANSTAGLRMPPGAPMTRMPVVVEWIRHPIGKLGSPIESSRYNYQLHGELNCYGYPDIGNWAPRSDKLIHQPNASNYVYGSMETRRDENKITLWETERRYNNFHLPIQERTTSGNVVQDVVTEYEIERHQAFRYQKNSFQLPAKVVTTRYDKRFSELEQVTTVTCTYDQDNGSVLSRHDSATGITETSTYYPVEGETDDSGNVLCPPDPIGMVRRLKSKTTRSMRSADPVLTTTYRYVEVPLRKGESFRPTAADVYIQAMGETLTREGVLEPLVESEQGFYTDQGDQHGALQWETRTQDGLTERRQFKHESAEITVDEPIHPERSGVPREASGIRTTTIHTTHDGIVTTSSETKRLLSGLVAETIDTLGNKTVTEHDLLGRTVAERYLPDDDAYATTSFWDYQIEATERWVRRTGVTGLHHRTWLDERGQPTRQEEPLPGNLPMTVSETTYDILGRAIRQTSHDLIHATPLTLHTATVYDDWGQPARVTAPDGSVTVSDRSFVEVDGEVMTRSRQWQEVFDTDTRVYAPVGAMQVVYTDAAGLKRRVEVGTWAPPGAALMEACHMQACPCFPTIGDDPQLLHMLAIHGDKRMRLEKHPSLPLLPLVEAAGSWVYDGLGRCIEQTDAMGQVTRQAYDHFGRLLTTTLPNGDVIGRTYAKGHEDELLVRIAAQPAGGGDIEVGTRRYDGLGRLVAETAGSLTHTFNYTDGQMSHDHHVMPAGGTIRRTYDWRLGETVTREWLVASRNVEGHSSTHDLKRKLPAYDKMAGDVELRSAQYDTRLGLPSLIEGGTGSMAIRSDYLGRMTEQTQSFAGEAPRESKVDVSPGGLELVRTGVDGKVQTLEYDDLGRLETMRDSDVTISFTYDELSRLVTRTTSDIDGQRSMLQRVGYDDLGRVNSTIWEHRDQGKTERRKLVLVYRPDNKVIEKRWYGETDDDVLRTETMDYDTRGRLTEHHIDPRGNPAECPVDEMNNPYTHQSFRHDVIDNLVSVETTLFKGGVNRTTYDHDKIDHDRVVMIHNSLAGYEPIISLQYDKNGNLTKYGADDNTSHVLTWDDAGRLSSVTIPDPDRTRLEYQYGPNGRLAQIVRKGSTSTRYYDNGALYLETTVGANVDTEERRFVRSGASVAAESRLTKAIRTVWLTASDPQGSIILDPAKHFGAPKSNDRHGSAG
ncbi:hypothetical protein KCV01_g3142, partial [Aureobasidium melanogenum]